MLLNFSDRSTKRTDRGAIELLSEWYVYNFLYYLMSASVSPPNLLGCLGLPVLRSSGSGAPLEDPLGTAGAEDHPLEHFSIVQVCFAADVWNYITKSAFSL
jgi:hypothetical protein